MEFVDTSSDSENDSKVFENSEDVLKYLMKKKIKTSTLVQVAEQAKNLTRAHIEMVRACRAQDETIKQLKVLTHAERQRNQLALKSYTQVQVDLLGNKQAYDRLLRDFVEIKREYEKLQTRQYTEFLLKSQARAVDARRKEPEEDATPDQAQKAALQERINSTDSAIESLRQEVETKCRTIADLEQKLEGLRNAVQVKMRILD